MNNVEHGKNKEVFILIGILVFIILVAVLGSTYAFFNYTKAGTTNSVGTGYIYFDYDEDTAVSVGNGFPITSDDVDKQLSQDFSITSHTTYAKGIKYRVYVVPGDAVSGKTSLRDDVISFEFTPPANGNGFTTQINNYSIPSSLTFTNGKALIATGLISGTTGLTTKDFNIKFWIDSNKISVSSTTKRATLAEGNPSLADATTGTTTAGRYMDNGSVLETVTLYPAKVSQQGKIIYTTKEFANSYYGVKLLIEAEENNDTNIIYLDANGGSVNNTIYTVTPNEYYPNLPTPTRTGYSFLGWVDPLVSESTYITSSTTVTKTVDHVLEAIWQANS